MARSKLAQRDEVHPTSAPVHGKHRSGAYRARVVSLREVRHVVRVRGGAQRAVAWVAGRQLSVITRVQLYAAGLDRRGIERRLDNGYLHRRHRGVYLVGSPIAPPGGDELAAVFACGDGALIGDRSALVLWECLARRPGPIDVVIAGRNRRQRDGIDIHRVERLYPADRQLHHGIPITSPARALIDFAAGAEADELEAAVSEARALKLIRDGDLEAALERAGTRKGVARVRELLSHEGQDSGYTRSKAERLVRRLLREADLPQPQCNARLLGQKPDFLWPEHRLVVQVDGYQFHGHRSAFERDRRKDQVLIAAGYRVVRVTWLQLRHEPLRVVAVIAAALTASRAPG